MAYNEAWLRALIATCTPTTATVPTGILGISDPNAKDVGVANLISETGAQWIRAEFKWPEIEPVIGGGYIWGPTDTMVINYLSLGLNIQAIITYVPPISKLQTLDEAYQAFVAALIQRYAPCGIHVWECFNEPNLPGYGWLPKGSNAMANMGIYAMMLARTNLAVRQYDPEGIVLIGGIANGAGAVPIETMMTFLYDLGCKDCFDVMAFHPYGYQAQFAAARTRVNAVLAAGNDSGKPVWFNEYGWTGQTEMNMSTHPTSATNPMLRALEERINADALFWFCGKDYSNKSGTPKFGLATFNLVKRPSFDTFKYFINTV